MKIVAFVKKHATAILIVVLLLSLGLNVVFLSQDVYQGDYYCFFDNGTTRVLSLGEYQYKEYTIAKNGTEQDVFFGFYFIDEYDIFRFVKVGKYYTSNERWEFSEQWTPVDFSVFKIYQNGLNRGEAEYICIEAIAVQAIWAIVDIVIIVALIKKAVRFFKHFKIVPKETTEQ